MPAPAARQRIADSQTPEISRNTAETASEEIAGSWREWVGRGISPMKKRGWVRRQLLPWQNDRRGEALWQYGQRRCDAARRTVYRVAVVARALEARLTGTTRGGIRHLGHTGSAGHGHAVAGHHRHPGRHDAGLSSGNAEPGSQENCEQHDKDMFWRPACHRDVRLALKCPFGKSKQETATLEQPTR